MENKKEKLTSLLRCNRHLPKAGENPLIGKGFHTLDDNSNFNWLGIIIGSPEPGWYFVMLFSWVDLRPTTGRLVRIEDMQDWFYWDEGVDNLLSKLKSAYLGMNRAARG